MSIKLDGIFIELDKLEKERKELEKYAKIYQEAKLSIKHGLFHTEEVNNFDEYYLVPLKGPKLLLQNYNYDIYLHKDNDEALFMCKKVNKVIKIVFDEISGDEIDKLRRYDELIGNKKSNDFYSLIREEAKKNVGYPNENGYRTYAVVYTMIVIIIGLVTVAEWGFFSFVAIFMALILPIILFGVARVIDILSKK